MSRLLFICVLLLVSQKAFSQSQYNTWCFGQGYGIDFNQSTPSVFSSSVYTVEGVASISNRWTGALLFYTDGVTVYNRQHNAMPNGTGLAGHSSAAQSALIVPKPGDTTKYYLFTADQEGYFGPGTGIHYSIVDMTRDSGRGDITTKNVSIQSTASEFMTAVKNSNGTDYWVITHGLADDNFYVWSVTSSGVASTPINSAVGTNPQNHVGLIGLTLGNLKASPNGQKLALTVFNGMVELFDFDPCSGTVSNAITIHGINPSTTWSYSSSFSPDNTKLYFNWSGSLYQYQLSPYTSSAILASGTVILDSNNTSLTLSDGGMQLAPNGKIYVRPAYMGTWLGIINNPNTRGQGCSFHANAIILPSRTSTNWINLPNDIDARNTGQALNLSIQGTTRFCPGGSATLSADTGFTSYRWSTGDTTRSITVTSSGTYVITATASSGCTASDSVVVTVFTPPAPVINPVGPTYICSGDSARLTSQLIYSRYRWSTGDTTRSIVVRSAGTYTLTVTDSNGCTGSTSTNVIVNPLPTPTISSPSELCQGDTITMAGQPGFNRYQWSTGDTTRTIRVWKGGTYTLTVTNSNGCKNSVSQTVKVNQLPTPTIASPTEFCQGDTIDMAGQPGFNRYQWSTGDTTRILRVWGAGTYTLTVTDSNGCKNVVSQTVKVNPLPTPTITSPAEFCQGDTITMSGDPGYDHYQWSTGDTTITIQVWKGGIYTLTVTNSNGCKNSVSQTVKVNPLPTPTIASPSEFCQGDTITMVGKPGYNSYKWSTGDTTRTINVWKGGTYTLTVTDANGCKNSVSQTVKVNPLPTPTIASPSEFCQGDTITMVGAPGYSSYKWSTGATTQSISVWSAGTYTLTVTDSKGCKNSVSQSVKVNPLPVPTIASPAAFCQGDTITMAGEPGFSHYQWSTGDTTLTTQVWKGGTYTLTVTNSNGCKATVSQTVKVNPLPAPTIASPSAFCQGDTITMVGAPGYNNYKWSTGDTTRTIDIWKAGTYTLTVTDSNGCSNFVSKTVTTNPLPEPTIAYQPSFCQGENMTLVGQPGFIHYTWSTGDTDRSIVVNTGGTYLLTVTDSNGCKGMVSATVKVNPPPTPVISAKQSFCQGDSATLYAEPGYISYLWSTGSTADSIVIRDPGTYMLTVVDSNGCTGTSTITIAALTVPGPVINGALRFCEGDSTVLSVDKGYLSYRWSTGDTTESIVVRQPGTYSVTVIGSNLCPGSASTTVKVDSRPEPMINGNFFFCHGDSTILDAGPGYTHYQWSTGDTTRTIVVRQSDTLSVTVTNASGCSGTSAQVVATKYDPPDARIVHIGSTVFCPGDSVLLQAVDSTASYLWSTGEKTRSIVARDSGIYRLIVTSSTGCIDSSSIAVRISNHLEPEISIAGPTGLCEGGKTILDAGAGYAKYLWSTGDTTRLIVVEQPGSYSVSVASGAGCTGTSAPVAITQHPKPTVAITPIGSTALCDGKSVVLKASGGFIAYLWSTGDTTQSITASGFGRFIVMAVDVNGCQASDTIIVSEAPKPAVSAGTDLTICPGGSASLKATGGVSYEWSPAQGLSCTDCADPIARPARTTTYVVSATDENGCLASDTVTVFVRSVPLLVKARIDNNYVLNPGKNISIPVVLEDSTDGSRVHSFDISMRFDSTVLRLDNAGDHSMLFNTLCDGWKAEVLKDSPGEFAARLTAPDGRWLSGTGRLMNLEFTGFLGKAPASIIDFNIALNDAPCTEVLADAGKVGIEVCGISDRLIELLPFGYELKQNHPNPFNPSTQIDFSIAFEDHVTLQVFDESGREVTRLVDGILQPGKYSVIFDATNFATGMYTYRFVAGSFVQTRQMTVVK